MTTENKNPELDALAGLAAEADIGTAPAAAAAGEQTLLPAEAPAPSQAEQVAALLFMFGQAGAMRFPSVAKPFTEEKCKAHGAAIAPALERLGWNLNAGESMIFLTAAGSVVMLLVETRNAILADLKAEQAATALREATPPAKAEEGIAAAAAKVESAPESQVHDQVKLYASDALRLFPKNG